MEGKGMEMSSRRCFSLFETTEIRLGCTKMEISTGKKNRERGNCLTLPTFDCTPGYAPDKIPHAYSSRFAPPLLFKGYGLECLLHSTDQTMG